MNAIPEKILLMRIDRLGDLILSLPAIYSIYKNYPDAQIDLLVNSEFVKLVSEINFLNKIYSINHSSHFKSVKTILCLRKNKYDLAIDLIPATNHLSSLILFFIKSKIKAGYATGFRKFFLNKSVPPPVQVKYETELVLDILKYLNIKTIKKNNLQINKNNIEGVNIILKKKGIDTNKKIIVIFPGASNKIKMWPKENFAALIKNVNSFSKFQIALAGSNSEKELCEEIKSQSNNSTKNLAGIFSIPQLCALIKKCNLVICNNSSPMHLAHVIKTPCIVINGFSSLTRWMPPKRNNFFVLNKDSEDFEKNKKKLSNVDKISVNEVFAIVKNFLMKK